MQKRHFSSVLLSNLIEAVGSFNGVQTPRRRQNLCTSARNPGQNTNWIFQKERQPLTFTKHYDKFEPISTVETNSVVLLSNKRNNFKYSKKIYFFSN
jgi:hypothetical protein